MAEKSGVVRLSTETFLDVSTHIDVSTPANMIVFMPRASNHTLISVSWKAESLLFMITWSSSLGLISSITCASHVPRTQIGVFLILSSRDFGSILCTLVNRSIPLGSRVASV